MGGTGGVPGAQTLRGTDVAEHSGALASQWAETFPRGVPPTPTPSWRPRAGTAHQGGDAEGAGEITYEAVWDNGAPLVADWEDFVAALIPAGR